MLYPFLKSKTLDKLVTKPRNAALEIFIIASLPIGSRARNGIRARKSDIQDVSVIVITVAVHAVPITSRGEGEGGFTNKWFSVIAICVAQDAIDLPMQC